MDATRRVCVVALFLAPTPLAAEDQATASLSVYADDDQATVSSPRASAHLDLSERVAVRAGYDADVITAATVDVRTSATPRAFEDTRHAGALGADLKLDRSTELGVSARGSTENDYDLVGGSLLVSRDFLDRTLTLTADYGIEYSLVGRTGDPTFAESLWGQRASAGATVVLDRRTVASLSYTLGVLAGYQASPYRFVPIYSADPSAQGRPVFVPERLPSVRERHAVALEVRRALDRELFVAGRLTGYVDGWGMTAGTLQTELERELLSGRLAVRAHGRGYVQGAARFHEERYETLPEAPRNASADRELGRMWSLMGGASIDTRVARGRRSGELWLRAGVDLLRFEYLDFAALDGRTAWLFALGATGRM
ncbi:MAG: DUF3570 domain-containing protein [Deltaproteobacteria bacterium]|nr:DUF3570 domain-containing protein [Deltaproteobacteria bacterium]